jgi:hypothetical protein
MLTLAGMSVSSVHSPRLVAVPACNTFRYMTQISMRAVHDANEYLIVYDNQIDTLVYFLKHISDLFKCCCLASSLNESQ